MELCGALRTAHWLEITKNNAPVLAGVYSEAMMSPEGLQSKSGDSAS